MKSVTIGTETLSLLAPGDILVTKDSNVRFGIIKSNVERLRDIIIADGEVRTPITVERIPADKQVEMGGYAFRVIVGHTRVAAVADANEKFKAGLLLPARVVEPVDAKTRLLMQISENHERAAFSPIDTAKAMKSMLDLGFSKMDVRNAFAVSGGKKGLKFGPCSNSHVNQTLEFLTYPKAMQSLIHDGRIGTSDAYAFAKYPKDKWAEICDRIETARLKRIEDEEAADAKADELAAKAVEAAAKIDGVATALQTAEAEAKTAAETAAKLFEEETAALKAARGKVADPATKKSLEAAYLEAQKNSKLAIAEQDKKDKALEVAKKKAANIEAKLKAAQDKTTAAKAAKATTNGNVTKADIKAAADASDTAPAKVTVLSPKEMRDTIATITRPTGMPKADEILKAFGQVFSGVLTQNQFVTVLGKLTGEYKAPIKPSNKQ